MKAEFMKEAISLSCEMMLQDKSGPFGAVIVKDKHIIGRGWNTVTSGNDPTAHAEINAIRDACRNLSTFNLSGCEIYSSCEPCPMCHAAICWARLERIYYACTRDDAVKAGFDDAKICEEIALHPQSQSLRMKQLLRDEALVAFDKWKNLPDRKLY
jgi:guanine deaminase